MKKIHSFYILGSVGFACTGLLHMVVVLITGNASLGTWMPMYIVWLAFMSIGLAITLREKRHISQSGGT